MESTGFKMLIMNISIFLFTKTLPTLMFLYFFFKYKEGPNRPFLKYKSCSFDQIYFLVIETLLAQQIQWRVDFYVNGGLLQQTGYFHSMRCVYRAQDTSISPFTEEDQQV